MRMAYDTILADYVDADTAAKGGGFEPYRYQCACCWEEVHICAADSRGQATHFRHRSGNNNVECENYLGSRSSIIHHALLRQNTRDRIDFYFSSLKKMFSVDVKFNADEILAYGHNEASFLVRISSIGEPIISVPIKGTRFLPDVSETIPITKFSWGYYISSSIDMKQREFEIFRKDASGKIYPSIFKIHVEDDNGNYQAKLIRSETLYTNTSYLIVFPYIYPCELSFQDVVVDNVMKFRTMDRDFSAFIVKFTKKTLQIERQLEVWKYRLELNESLALLWPPSSQSDGLLDTSADSVIIYSSFELQAHGNINVPSSDICKFDNGLSKISISGITKIYKKNAELILRKIDDTFPRYQELFVDQLSRNNYEAHDDSAYLYNRMGVVRLSKGTSSPITISSSIRHYSFGYLDCIVTAKKNSNILVGSDLIQDIIKNYKRVEKFDWTDYELLDLSQEAFAYIETCEKTGMINSAAKYFITEGRI